MHGSSGLAWPEHAGHESSRKLRGPKRIIISREHRRTKPSQETSIRSQKRCVTTVTGNLEGPKSLADAETWLCEKLSSLNGLALGNVSSHADYKSHQDRDLAVSIPRGAGVEYAGKQGRCNAGNASVERASGPEVLVQKMISNHEEARFRM